MARVVVLGSTNTDMTVRLPRLPEPGQTVLGGSFLKGAGGKGANQAVAARRAGADVIFLTAVGDDELGRQALERYRAEGIGVSHVEIVAGEPSGVALIFVDDRGENMIGVASGANARLRPAAIDRLPDSVFRAGDVMLAGLEVPLDTVARAVRRARAAGMRVILNPAPADRGILELEVLEHVDILTPNQVEARMLAGTDSTAESEDPVRDAECLAEHGVATVIVTRGARGCVVVRRGAGSLERLDVPAYPVKSVDTVGAGDAFSGALAAALAEGRTLLDAVAWASAAAAISVTRPGAQQALPSRQEIASLVERGQNG